MQRMWINQPSTLQPHHNLHGTNVLVEDTVGVTRRVYFLNGPIVSQEILTPALSWGWR